MTEIIPTSLKEESICSNACTPIFCTTVDYWTDAVKHSKTINDCIDIMEQIFEYTKCAFADFIKSLKNIIEKADESLLFSRHIIEQLLSKCTSHNCSLINKIAMFIEHWKDVSSMNKSKATILKHLSAEDDTPILLVNEKYGTCKQELLCIQIQILRAISSWKKAIKEINNHHL